MTTTAKYTPATPLPHVSNFRRVMHARGHIVSFSEAADILVDAGICERINNGIALITDADKIRLVEALQLAAMARAERT